MIDAALDSTRRRTDASADRSPQQLRLFRTIRPDRHHRRIGLAKIAEIRRNLRSNSGGDADTRPAA